MGIPVVLVGQGFVNAVVEVLVVGKDNVATDIVEEAFWSDIGRGKTTRRLVGINNHPRGTIDLVQALCGTQTSRSSSNDEDVNIDICHVDCEATVLCMGCVWEVQDGKECGGFLDDSRDCDRGRRLLSRCRTYRTE